MKQSFWQDKKVFVTGHTGFKGSWLCLWLQKMGAQVTGFSLAPPTQPSLYELANVADSMNSIIGDIRDAQLLSETMNTTKPDIVFHLAAQSLVRESYENPIETYSTNVMGSLNVLEAVKNTKSIKAVVMVSTDKCYENKESATGYTEQDRLGGFDPYSSSKACLEILINSYRQSFLSEKDCHIHVASTRAGNVIGGGDYAKDRLVPDILKAISQQENIELRFPHAIRPWQHVLEPLSGYLLLAEKLFHQGSSFSQAWNFGPDVSSEKTVQWIAQYLLTQNFININITINENTQPHETSYLTLNCEKSRHNLNWYSIWSIEKTLDKVIEWYQLSQTQPHKLKELCISQIQEYQINSEEYENN